MNDFAAQLSLRSLASRLSLGLMGLMGPIDYFKLIHIGLAQATWPSS